MKSSKWLSVNRLSVNVSAPRMIFCSVMGRSHFNRLPTSAAVQRQYFSSLLKQHPNTKQIEPLVLKLQHPLYKDHVEERFNLLTNQDSYVQAFNGTSSKKICKFFTKTELGITVQRKNNYKDVKDCHKELSNFLDQQEKNRRQSNIYLTDEHKNYFSDVISPYLWELVDQECIIPLIIDLRGHGFSESPMSNFPDHCTIRLEGNPISEWGAFDAIMSYEGHASRIVLPENRKHFWNTEINDYKISSKIIKSADLIEYSFATEPRSSLEYSTPQIYATGMANNLLHELSEQDYEEIKNITVKEYKEAQNNGGNTSSAVDGSKIEAQFKKAIEDENLLRSMEYRKDTYFRTQEIGVKKENSMNPDDPKICYSPLNEIKFSNISNTTKIQYKEAIEQRRKLFLRFINSPGKENLAVFFNYCKLMMNGIFLSDKKKAQSNHHLITRFMPHDHHEEFLTAYAMAATMMLGKHLFQLETSSKSKKEIISNFVDINVSESKRFLKTAKDTIHQDTLSPAEKVKTIKNDLKKTVKVGPVETTTNAFHALRLASASKTNDEEKNAKMDKTLVELSKEMMTKFLIKYFSLHKPENKVALRKLCLHDGEEFANINPMLFQFDSFYQNNPIFEENGKEKELKMDWDRVLRQLFKEIGDDINNEKSKNELYQILYPEFDENPLHVNQIHQRIANETGHLRASPQFNIKHHYVHFIPKG